jgi:hypothetical protein
MDRRETGYDVNPNKPTWFAIGMMAGVVLSGVGAAYYLFRRLQKL